MKLSNQFFYTLREDAKDEETRSGNYLVRSGMIKKVGTGIYLFMPLGLKVLKKIETIIREEMNKAGAQEVLMPSLIPEDYYIQSGRKDVFGHDMFSLKDRYNRGYVLGPTHEELFVYAAKEMIHSYKDMPFNIYQIANKYRDEPRPRFGLIRTREFAMKDAYSFDVDEEGCEVSYQKMFQAYQNIFDRIGLNYKIVRAGTGAMGGSLSEEFQAVVEIGEDTLVLCPNCDYASNLEVSACIVDETESYEEEKELELVHTPNAGTIEEISEFLMEDKNRFVKTLIYKVDDKFYACLIPGDRDLNEDKLRQLLNGKEAVLADIEEVERITKAKVGFAGPIDLSIPIIMDHHVQMMKNFIVGANKTDYHYKNVNLKDFKVKKIGDIINVQEGDLCPKCGAKLTFKKGIECGNTFKLGTKYSESLGLNYLDKEKKLRPVVMGCYGIGLARIMTSVAEQNADDMGIAWPAQIAPFEVALVLINEKDEVQKAVADKLYQTIQSMGFDVVYDDRKERPGVKFKDMELIGVPVQITVGKRAVEGIVEIKRRGKEKEEISLDLLNEKIVELLNC